MWFISLDTRPFLFAHRCWIWILVFPCGGLISAGLLHHCSLHSCDLCAIVALSVFAKLAAKNVFWATATVFFPPFERDKKCFVLDVGP